ncbi:MAG TPA: GreA/GreB family elongation factor [Ramlibacter sp.]|nr:GreA/GreB family elongation factor [Ramlibacter sp.]
MEPFISAERTLTRTDHVRLSRLLDKQRGTFSGAEAMQDVLESSELVASPAVPPTVVTMHTQVLLQDPQRDAPPYRLTLCYPDRAEPAQGFVSVLSPLGTALLGLHAGEIARWRKPDGSWGAARIVAVLFQPEASGDYQS